MWKLKIPSNLWRHLQEHTILKMQIKWELIKSKYWSSGLSFLRKQKPRPQIILLALSPRQLYQLMVQVKADEFQQNYWLSFSLSQPRTCTAWGATPRVAQPTASPPGRRSSRSFWHRLPEIMRWIKLSHDSASVGKCMILRRVLWINIRISLRITLWAWDTAPQATKRENRALGPTCRKRCCNV